MADDDPLRKLRLFVGYTVTGVWATLFIAGLIRPPSDTAVYFSIQAIMAIVAGGLYAQGLIRKNGRPNGS